MLRQISGRIKMAKKINVDELIEFCNTSRSMLHEHYNSGECKDCLLENNPDCPKYGPARQRVDDEK